MPVAPGAYWDLLDRSTPPVKRRAAHAKARTGCLTCKRRRVKCDEAKPACARCVKSGHGCAGYESGGPDPPPKTASSKHPVRPAARLLPRPEPAEEDLVRASLAPRYLDAGDDALYFGRFRCQMLADLGTWCGAEYWRHTILREVMVDETVRHAALAAAALLMDIEQQQRERCEREHTRRRQQLGTRRRASPLQAAAVGEIGAGATAPATAGWGPGDDAVPPLGDARGQTPPPVVPLSGTSAHGRAALRHYTAAISRCRRTLAAEGVTARTARTSLTAAFFFAVFELVRGDVGEAGRLLVGGASLLDDALSRTRAGGGSGELVLDDELHQVRLAFDRMRVTWGLCPYFGTGTGTSTGTGTGTAGHRRAGHFEVPSPAAPVRAKQVFWNAFSSDFGEFMLSVRRRWGTTTAMPSPTSRGALLARRAGYLAQLRRHWLPLLADLCARDPGSALLCTTRAYAQTALVFLCCFPDPSHLAYDAHLPVFRDVVAAYRRLLSPEEEEEAAAVADDYNSHPYHHHNQHQKREKEQKEQQQQQGGYHLLRLTLDTDLFHIIAFVVSRCRDHDTRRLALRVFAATTCRQALWTNAGMLAALRALADLEDSGRDADGLVPASARYDYVGSEWDFEGRRMVAVFVPVLSPRGDGGDAVRVPISF
ncbi:hypothetical protein F4802DRAFT_191432 [Xylaria palmicola]|nr:hypothetical protein F4802DRAFT_191432 [Xylaria palmicola]